MSMLVLAVYRMESLGLNQAVLLLFFVQCFQQRIISSIIGENTKHNNRWCLLASEHSIIGKIWSIMCPCLGRKPGVFVSSQTAGIDQDRHDRDVME